ncbi:MAG: NAD-dependent epimerase/dehydratase family protein [Gemmatimonadetes bacterium]|nr:NAD-dependent epimerase/dehydratase family protein [Gemmatimonadota bacterium]
MTGASGFIGAALLRHLAPRWSLAALYRRRDPGSEFWEREGCRVVYGDLDDQKALAALVRDADVVFHCAARMAKDDLAASQRVNVAGTERLARAALANGVARFIYVSSISVYAATRRAGPTITEDLEPANLGRLNAYSFTKYQGELRVRGLAARDGLGYTIVRPTNVYGPRSGPWFLQLERLLRRVPVAIGDVPIDVVYLDDLLVALQEAALSSAAVNQTFHIGHQVVRLRDFIALVGEVVGRRARRLPAAADYLLRAAIEHGYRLATGKCMSMSLTRPAFYPHTKAERTFGYAPRVGLQEGFGAIAEWYRERDQREGRRVAL